MGANFWKTILLSEKSTYLRFPILWSKMHIPNFSLKFKKNFLTSNKCTTQFGLSRLSRNLSQHWSVLENFKIVKLMMMKEPFDQNPLENRTKIQGIWFCFNGSVIFISLTIPKFSKTNQPRGTFFRKLNVRFYLI